MALGVHVENDIYTILSIPLEWEEKSMIVNHLRMLANEIENAEVEILNFRLSTPMAYGKSTLECICFDKSKKS